MNLSSLALVAGNIGLVGLGGYAAFLAYSFVSNDLKLSRLRNS